MLYQICAVNYEDIPEDILDDLDEQDTGLYSVDKDSKFGEWLVSLGYKFEKDWGWIGIWN